MEKFLTKRWMKNETKRFSTNIPRLWSFVKSARLVPSPKSKRRRNIVRPAEKTWKKIRCFAENGLAFP
jgi:hypothetical protein